jgi:hypothetical protein
MCISLAFMRVEHHRYQLPVFQCGFNSHLRRNMQRVSAKCRKTDATCHAVEARRSVRCSLHWPIRLDYRFSKRKAPGTIERPSQDLACMVSTLLPVLYRRRRTQGHTTCECVSLPVHESQNRDGVHLMRALTSGRIWNLQLEHYHGLPSS